MRPGPARAALVGLVAVAATLSACGGEETPAETVPELADHLQDVDDAVAEGDADAALDALADLRDAASEAEESGDLSAGDADAILAAAERLESRLNDEPPPEPQPAEETPTQEPTASESPAPADEEDESEDDDLDEEDEGPGGSEKEKKPEKDKGGKGKGKGKGKG